MLLKRMQAINIIGYIDDVDRVLKKVMSCSMLNIINANKELQQSSIFSENADMSCVIKECRNTYNLEEVKNRLDYLMEQFNIKVHSADDVSDWEYDFNEDINKINEIFIKIREKEKEAIGLKSELNDIKKLEEYLSYISKTNADFKALMNMKFVKFKIGRLVRYNMDKLKKNYENIPAIIFRLNEDRMYSVILLLFPDAVEIEVTRAVSSLGFEEYKSSLEEKGTVYEYIHAIHGREEELKRRIKEIEDCISCEGKKHGSEVAQYYLRLKLELMIERSKSSVACINDFFYLTGLIPRNKRYIIEKQLEPYSDRIIVHFEEGERAAG